MTDEPADDGFVVHFEGIPGSGKTTAARTFCAFLRARGVDAEWVLEESADHPVMPDAIRRRSSEGAFPEVCLKAWHGFATENRRVSLLDGYAFQTTARLMYANRFPRKQIDDYFDAWQQVTPARSALVFFTVDDVGVHYDGVCRERGADWTAKLVEYVAKTPLGRYREWTDLDGFVEFWSRYQDLCLELIDRASVPTMTVPARSWDDGVLERIATWALPADVEKTGD